MVTAYLSMGSNIGDREFFLRRALEELNNNPKIAVTKVSSFYETAPVGYLDQGNFLNIALEIETLFLPEELLKTTQDIEKKLKRTRDIHWGPRTIDIDIITYGNEAFETESLTIPHKEALNRAFVLLPLLEIAGESFEINGQNIKGVLERTPHEENIIWLYQETLPS